MKKTFALLILIFFGYISYCQSSKHFLFGIDLKSDWYTLTNYQQLTYYLTDSDTNNNDLWVITDFEYSYDKIDKTFSEIGFNELLLGFPKGMQSNLQELQPEIFLARKNYKDIKDYYITSESDISKTKYLLNQEFGDPESNMIRDKYLVYEWNGVNYQIVLTCREDELTTTLIYTKG